MESGDENHIGKLKGASKNAIPAPILIGLKSSGNS
jgi:hypothetical protein